VVCWRSRSTLQGGSPEGYSRSQPWVNSSFETGGRLRPAYMSRLERILDRADELGMIAIVGFFYQAQERRMNGEQSVVRAADAATGWLIDKGYTNVLVEVANEADNAGRLDVGDYYIDGGIVIERKTYADFAMSLTEGRLFPQAAALVRSPHRPVVLLDGPKPAKSLVR